MGARHVSPEPYWYHFTCQVWKDYDVETVEVNFTRASDILDDSPIDSLILMVNWETKGELMSLFCTDGQWIVTLSDGEGIARISWANFVKIFSEFSVFVAQQGLAMVEECERSKPADTSE